MATRSVTTSELERRALELGLDAVGFCRAEPYLSTERDIADRMDRGLFADLKFTMARPEVSCHPERLVDGALSVVSAALCYWAPDPLGADTGTVEGDGPRGRIARYTRSDGYERLRDRLGQLAAMLQEAGFAATVVVDSNDHVDREAAARSGVGFYGKHSNLITRRHGSWVVLGTIVTDAPLDPTEPVRPGCGDCTACIDACPTRAIVADGTLAVGACISYLTQSRHAIPESMREAMHDMVYGCDICQEVCPWNRGVERRRASSAPVDGTVSLAEWLGIDDATLNSRYQRFFVPRRNVDFLRRNALVALGNVGSRGDRSLAVPFLASPQPLLREHAQWAIDAMERRATGDG